MSSSGIVEGSIGAGCSPWRAAILPKGPSDDVIDVDDLDNDRLANLALAFRTLLHLVCARKGLFFLQTGWLAPLEVAVECFLLIPLGHRLNGVRR